MNAAFMIAYGTIVRKEVRRFLRIWIQTLFPPAITMTLYFVIFGKMVGSQVGDVHNFSYMQFIVPGLIMMPIITSCYAGVSSALFGAKFQRNIEEVLIAPVPDLIFLLGFLTGGVVRGLLVGLIVTIISFFFTNLMVHNLLIILTVALLTATLFSLAGFINAIYAKKFDDISLIPTFLLTPLTYLGGIFYSVSLLPPFWQTVSLFNPILYIVSAFRYGVLGIADVPIAFSIGALLGLVVILFLFCLYLLKKGIGLRS